MSINYVSIQENLEQYLIDPSVRITDMRLGGRLNSVKIITLSDGTEWIPLLDGKGKERFCGFLFLKKALEEAGQKNAKAAENKLFLNDNNVIYLSSYCGEKKPDFLEFQEEKKAIQKAGFTDMTFNANLRIVEGELRVFDTEKGSFDPIVHSEIDQMEETREKIEALLFSKINNKN